MAPQEHTDSGSYDETHDEWRISNAVALGWTCIDHRWLDYAGGRSDLTGVPPGCRTNDACRIPGFSEANVTEHTTPMD